MKMKYFLLSVFSVCVVAFVFACANGSGGGKPSNNQGGDKPSVETDIKGVWATKEFQSQKGGKARALLAFDETHAYHADEHDGVLDKKGFKMSYTFVGGNLSIPSVEKMMTFSVAKDEITVHPAKGSPYKMYRVEKPTLDELKAICK